MDIYQSLVTVNPVTLIAMICNLFIQLFLAKKLFLDKVKAILDQRREAADKEIADAYHNGNGFNIDNVDNYDDLEEFLAYVKDGMEISVAMDGTVTVK